jgi:competence protein ComEA
MVYSAILFAPKFMWQQFVKDYLTFTKKERTAVLVLLAFILLVVLLPYLWPSKKIVKPVKKEIEALQRQMVGLKKTDSGYEEQAEKASNPAANSYPNKKNYNNEKAVLFDFDPNTLSAADWKRLGLRAKTIQTIQKYLSKGGKFRQPEDLKKVYGLFPDEYERLLPYIKISGQHKFEKKEYEEKKEYTANSKPVYTPKNFSSLKIIDINTADTTALMALPGIGSRLAARILNFRDKLGGFYAVAQVAETYGLPDSTFQKIKTFLQCGNAVLRQLNINTADLNTLRQHPYIRWNLANIIVQYRLQHGNFKSVEALQQVTVITPEIFQKIKPYLVIE